MAKAAEIVSKTGRVHALGGNISAYSVIHQGPTEKIHATVERAIVEGSDMPMPGCDFWLETPTEHVKSFVEAVKEISSDLG
jgi:uroporphyrinogen-III decarboxylase